MKRYTQNETDKLAEILKKDGIISVPTDTVYGICARMNSIKAYDNLMEIKKRFTTKIFPIMCADKEQIDSVAIIDEKVEKLIHSFMPGPITLILKKKLEIPNYVTNGLATIAVRMANSKALEDLIRKTECPIFMTSANKSGQATCTNIDEIEKTFPTLDAIMEGDVLFGKGSTIVDCVSEPIKILREGPISMEQIIEALN